MPYAKVNFDDCECEDDKQEKLQNWQHTNKTSRRIHKAKTHKQESRETIGITRKTAERFVKLAENKAVIEQAKVNQDMRTDLLDISPKGLAY